jgi:hypothetical protein
MTQTTRHTPGAVSANPPSPYIGTAMPTEPAYVSRRRPLYRLVEQRRDGGAERVLLGGQPDLTAVLAAFEARVTRDAHTGGDRYRMVDGRYRLTVTTDHGAAACSTVDRAGPHPATPGSSGGG